MTQPTDQSLKLALAKMLPEKVRIWHSTEDYLTWKSDLPIEQEVLDTELLHLCWLVEQTLDESKYVRYWNTLCNDLSIQGHKKTFMIMEAAHASWQQRTTALAKVLGVEIL